MHSADTANKVVTAHSNGTVALYDVEKSGSKFDGLRTPHPSGRGINVVSFGGPSGQGAFIASGCQDGDIAILVCFCLAPPISFNDVANASIRTSGMQTSLLYLLRSIRSGRSALRLVTTLRHLHTTSSQQAKVGTSRDGI